MSRVDHDLDQGDCERLVGKQIKSATTGRVPDFEYDVLELEFEDGSRFQVAPWDYEGFSAGMYSRWLEKA